MGVYSDVYGVDDSLDDLAKFLQWADNSWATITDPDQRVAQTTSNLNQFWDAEKSYDTTNGGVIHLDAIAHRTLGFLYYMEMAWTDFPDKAKIPQLGQLAHEQFQAAYNGFSQVAGDENLAAAIARSDAAVIQDASDWEANVVDDSYTAAVGARLTELKDDAAKGLSLAGSILSSPLLYVGIAAVAALVLWVVIKGHR